MSRTGGQLALALLLFAACGQSPAESRDAQPGSSIPEIASTSDFPPVATVKVDQATCEQFVIDLLSGAQAVVQIDKWSGSTRPTSNPAFRVGDYVVPAKRWESKTAADQPALELAGGELQLVTLNQDPDQAKAMFDGVGLPAMGVISRSEFVDEHPWRLLLVLSGDQARSGDTCAPTYTARLRAVAETINSDLADAVVAGAGFLENPDDPTLSGVREALGFGPATAPPSDQAISEKEWLRIPVEQRELAFGKIPRGYEDAIDVYGLHIVLTGDVVIGDLTFVCEYGVGYGVVTDFSELTRPLTTCRTSETDVLFDGKVVGTIPASALDAQLGMEVVIDFGAEPVLKSVASLEPGELERLTGLTRDQLEQARLDIRSGETPSL